jgi:hypothetical protein
MVVEALNRLKCLEPGREEEGRREETERDKEQKVIFKKRASEPMIIN